MDNFDARVLEDEMLDVFLAIQNLCPDWEMSYKPYSSCIKIVVSDRLEFNLVGSFIASGRVEFFCRIISKTIRFTSENLAIIVKGIRKIDVP